VSERPRTGTEIGVSTIFLYFIVLAALFVISIWFLYVGLTSYVSGEFETATVMALIGVIGLGISLIVLRRLRRRIMVPLQQPLIPLNVLTVEQCDKCGFKNVKKFERGDYVFKTAEKCPKCGTLTTITSIYYEGLVKKQYP